MSSIQLSSGVCPRFTGVNFSHTWSTGTPTRNGRKGLLGSNQTSTARVGCLFWVLYCVLFLIKHGASQVVQWLNNLPAMQETQGTQIRSLVREDPLVKGMATHSTILAWRIPWTEEPGGLLQSMRLQRVGHDWSDWALKHGWTLQFSDIQYNVSVEALGCCTTLDSWHNDDIIYISFHCYSIILPPLLPRLLIESVCVCLRECAHMQFPPFSTLYSFPGQVL